MSHATLCVLSYNRPEFLDRCIETASDAGVPLEIIVHDDGSSDPQVYETLEYLRSEKMISTVITNPPHHNQGQGTALNRMFAMATGDPIVKVDQDMVFNPGWMLKVNEILEDERVGLLAFFKYWYDPVDWRKTGIEGLPSPSTHSYHTHICGSAFALPRIVWEQMKPFEEHSEAFAEDWDMQNRIHKLTDRECALPTEDLATNVGFGATSKDGPKLSTIVNRDDNGDFTVSKIHREPWIIQ